jgi:hypothetical protein
VVNNAVLATSAQPVRNGSEVKGNPIRFEIGEDFAGIKERTAFGCKTIMKVATYLVTL